MSQQKRRKPTIKDVAELVGVHHSTVSRALSPNKRSKISPAVVKQVEKAVRKLGYRPNFVASSLKKSRSYALGVLIPDLMNPVFPPIIRGIQDTAEVSDYTVITANTDDELSKEKQALRMMQSRFIDGLIIATARLEDPIVKECIEEDIPFVLLNRTVADGQINAVIVDEDFGIRRIVEHLFSLGHRNIVYIAGPMDTSTGYDRVNAYRSCMRGNGLKECRIETTAKYTIEEGFAAYRRLRKYRADFTAVMAGNDLLALGCIDAIREEGLRVPNDISVVGYNDMPFLERMNPPLTTVMIPKYEMGSHATKMVLDIIAGESYEPVILRMQPKLVIRSSTARVRRGRIAKAN